MGVDRYASLSPQRSSAWRALWREIDGLPAGMRSLPRDLAMPAVRRAQRGVRDARRRPVIGAAAPGSDIRPHPVEMDIALKPGPPVADT